MDVLGTGVVLLGRSGIGKSECALDLILRGHRIVADDIIHLEKRGPITVLGSGSDLTRHNMEIRGLGIISIRDLFGLSAITDTKKLELVIEIEEWDPDKEYDRLGLEDRRTVFLGVSLPTLLIPVSPGRSLATIVEVAVRNHILKTQGVHSARDLVDQHARRTEGNAPR
jgi:HPr kinase/phosphorylase